MKYLLLIGAVCLSLVGCAKKYKCTCQAPNGGYADNRVYKAKDRAHAERECQGLQDVFSNRYAVAGYSCTLAGL